MVITKREDVTKQGGRLFQFEWEWERGGVGVGGLYEAGCLLTFSAFRMGRLPSFNYQKPLNLLST